MKAFNLILLALLLAFGAYEIVSVAYDEPGQDQMLTLSEWVWNLGLWARCLAGTITAWATLHFIFPQYDPVLRLMRR